MGEHRFAGARRPDEQQVVPARGGNLESASGERLAFHVEQVASVGTVRPERAVDAGTKAADVTCRLPRSPAAQAVDQRSERRSGVNFGTSRKVSLDGGLVG